MKKQLLMIFVLMALLSSFAIGQNTLDSDQQKINRFVARLSWESTRLEYNVLVHIHPNDEAASALIQIGKPATDALLAALEDEQKARAAHLILYIVWVDNRGIYPVTSNAVYKKKFFKKKMFAVNYEFFGLKWTERDNVPYTDKKDLGQNAAKWRERILAFRAESGK